MNQNLMKKIQLNLTMTNNNFNERTTNTLNQQQDAINKTLDNILNNVKRTTDEATREIPRYTQRLLSIKNKLFKL